MFLWCSYCQHLIGEAGPFDDYGLSHGVCLECRTAMEDPFCVDPNRLPASRLLKKLMATAATASGRELTELIEEIRRSNVCPSDMLLGIVQPALYEIGQRWQRGDITPEDEHRFTELCRHVSEQICGLPVARPGAPSLLLALAPDNRHDLGVRFLSELAREHGVGCRVLPAGTSASDIVQAIASERPSAFGLSVCMTDTLDEVDELALRCSRAAPMRRVLVGGYAVRKRPTVTFEHATVVRRVDDFIAELALLDTAPSEGGRGPGREGPDAAEA